MTVYIYQDKHCALKIIAANLVYVYTSYVIWADHIVNMQFQFKLF